jgi:C2 domain in Dock180 and Zizimin proteins
LFFSYSVHDSSLAHESHILSFGLTLCFQSVFPLSLVAFLWEDLYFGLFAVFLQNVISEGAGGEMISEYRSVVHYHEDKPRWMETVKVMY